MRHFVARLVDFNSSSASGGLDLSSASGGLDLSSASCAAALGGLDSVGMPVFCWSFEPLIGFPLEPVCNSELFAPHSPISPLEPDMGGGTTFRGALGGLTSSSASCELALGGLELGWSARSSGALLLV